MISSKIKRSLNSIFHNISSKSRLKSARSDMSGLIKDKDCFVLGSGPKPSLERLKDNMSLICVNGSPAVAKKLDLPSPVMTVVDFELLDPSVNRSNPVRSFIIKNKLLKELDLGFIVSTQSNGSAGGCPNELEGLYSGFSKLYKFDCRTIVHQATKVNNLENDVHGLLSRGAFAIALCAWMGASSITFSGFSLKRKNQNASNYFYGDITNDDETAEVKYQSLKGWDTMAHTMADCQLLGQLVLNGHKIYSDSEDFIPLLQNWGHVPPSWAKRD